MRRLAEGIPVSFVAALAAAVLVAILYTVATREPKEARGYAELTLRAGDCTVEPQQALNATRCERLGPGLYRVIFTKSLAGSTVVASRGSCCPGEIAASVETETAVLVVIEGTPRRPIRATVLVP